MKGETEEPAGRAKYKRTCCREVCDRLIPPEANGNRRFCSSHCRRAYYRECQPHPLRSQHAWRACLRCGKNFRSESKANRVCPGCTSINSRQGREYSLKGGR